MVITSAACLAQITYNYRYAGGRSSSEMLLVALIISQEIIRPLKALRVLKITVYLTSLDETDTPTQMLCMPPVTREVKSLAHKIFEWRLPKLTALVLVVEGSRVRLLKQDTFAFLQSIKVSPAGKVKHIVTALEPHMVKHHVPCADILEEDKFVLHRWEVRISVHRLLHHDEGSAWLSTEHGFLEVIITWSIAFDAPRTTKREFYHRTANVHSIQSQHHITQNSLICIPKKVQSSASKVPANNSAYHNGRMNVCYPPLNALNIDMRHTLPSLISKARSHQQINLSLANLQGTILTLPKPSTSPIRHQTSSHFILKPNTLDTYGDDPPLAMTRSKLHLRRRLSKLVKWCKEYHKERADARKRGYDGLVPDEDYEGYVPLIRSNLCPAMGRPTRKHCATKSRRYSH